MIYTKEELAAKVRVPAVVEQDLKRIISDRLEQCGMYYRVFSRIKTAGSMAHKFETKEYGEGRKKLQDLVGVRVNLYFDDDVDICRNIMENTFDVIDWSTSEMNDEEFKPTKLNGVCRLPAYLRSEISPETWKMCIDDTFEIQIKTMFLKAGMRLSMICVIKGKKSGKITVVFPAILTVSWQHWSCATSRWSPYLRILGIPCISPGAGVI
ncbi:MAG: hypothetical protein ACLTSZ_15535 [Lachnospiraceae bacterium]